MSLKDWLLIRY